MKKYICINFLDYAAPNKTILSDNMVALYTCDGSIAFKDEHKDNISKILKDDFMKAHQGANLFIFECQSLSDFCDTIDAIDLLQREYMGPDCDVSNITNCNCFSVNEELLVIYHEH